MSKLIECPMCEKMISPNASSCPNCGEPMEILKEIEVDDGKEYKYELVLVHVGTKEYKVRTVLSSI